MLKRTFAALTVGAALAALAGPSWAQQVQESNEEKRVIQGPSRTSFGRLDVILPEGARSEVEYQPDAGTLVVRTQQGEARIVTSARYLILVETVAGKVEIRLADGRIINVEPGQSEIVGQALVDDPGLTIIRLNGTGPWGGPAREPDHRARGTGRRGAAGRHRQREPVRHQHHPAPDAVAGAVRFRGATGLPACALTEPWGPRRVGITTGGALVSLPDAPRPVLGSGPKCQNEQRGGARHVVA
jgi:hypothetical protein